MKRRRRQTSGAALKRGRPADGDGDSWYEQPASDGFGVPPATGDVVVAGTKFSGDGERVADGGDPAASSRDDDDAADEDSPVGDDDKPSLTESYERGHERGDDGGSGGGAVRTPVRGRRLLGGAGAAVAR